MSNQTPSPYDTKLTGHAAQLLTVLRECWSDLLDGRYGATDQLWALCHAYDRPLAPDDWNGLEMTLAAGLVQTLQQLADSGFRAATQRGQAEKWSRAGYALDLALTALKVQNGDLLCEQVTVDEALAEIGRYRVEWAD